MNAQVIIRPPRYKPEYVRMKRLGPKGRVDARERDRKMYMLMQDRDHDQKGKVNA